ncbi:MAG: phosphatase [Bacteroidetes bacterium]|nr:MAG: phosphatase [Bacteroidota bacterium]REK05103.1 MAG: phosphatase [Bacteroidota bacterium]REK32509.1 MAG: phosphatase [Bacteroidota bacterium]REK49044.1 MAG: phosphatase [Bacteroidota bacterium]
MRNRRIAVLDLGTNTFHLLIADLKPDSTLEKVFKSKKVVKLGEGAINRNLIAETPFQRGLNAIEHYAGIIKEHRTDEVYAFATSAVRSAQNGSDFVEEVKKRTGIEIRVISGEEEARLISLGVHQCVEFKDKASLIMDIGGGSTEFIIVSNNGIHAKHSFNIGAARLLEKFKPSDPITEEEIASIHKFLSNEVAPLDDSIKKYPVSELIGSSGSFDTFAEMIGYRFYGKNIIKNVNHYKFEIREYKKLHELILKSTFNQRLKMKGLIRMRVDMIVLASVCTMFVLRRYKINELHLSKYALKEGALWEIIQEQTQIQF